MVHVTGQHSPSTALETVTLQDVLTQEMAPSLGECPEDPPSTPKFRLKLAAILASTALQLQTTPWLNNSWDSNDVLFHTGIAVHPYITKSFNSDVNQIENPVKLAELCLGKPLDHFRTPEDPSILTDSCMAKRLVEDMAEKVSTGYADAVKACIYCDFGMEVKDHSFDNDAFRQAVLEYVVTPLEDDWRHFNRI